MRLKALYEYNKERFPEFEIEIASRLNEGKETIFIDFKTIIGVHFCLEDINEETILEDVAKTVRQGLYQHIVNSQIGDSSHSEIDEQPKEIEAEVEVAEDTIVELVADEDRKVFP